jgi:hypothetical protein
MSLSPSAAASTNNNHAPFNEIYRTHQMTNHFLSLDLRYIIFDLLAPDQCYWEWKESCLPVIGDLNEFRLHMHSLPQYLRLKDDDRRAKLADVITQSYKLHTTGGTHNAVTALIASWQLGEHTHHQERDM